MVADLVVRVGMAPASVSTKEVRSGAMSAETAGLAHELQAELHARHVGSVEATVPCA
jgi:hypothetical protein